MKLLFPVVFVLLTSYLIVQSVQDKLPIDTSLIAEQKIEISLDSGIDRVVINLQNVTFNESVAFWTMFVGETEKPENEIGPQKYRTLTLAPKIKDPNDPIRKDNKELVLNTNGADKLVISVEKGKVNIQVKPYKRKI